MSADRAIAPAFRDDFNRQSPSDNPGTHYGALYLADGINQLAAQGRIPPNATLTTSVSPQALIGAGLDLRSGQTLTLQDATTGASTQVLTSARGAGATEFTYTTYADGAAVVVRGSYSPSGGLQLATATAFHDPENLSHGQDVTAQVQAALTRTEVEVGRRGAGLDVVNIGRAALDEAPLSPSPVAPAETMIPPRSESAPAPAAQPPAQPDVVEAPAPAPSVPILTTLRVNANTVFTLNEEGDYIGETTTLGNGFTETRDIAGNASYTGADGRVYDAGQYQTWLQEQTQGGSGTGATGGGSGGDLSVTGATGDTAGASVSAAGALSVTQALLSLNHFNDLSTLQQVGALAKLYNAGAQLSGGSLTPVSGTATGALSFLAALESGDDGAIIVSGANLGSQLLAGTAVGSALATAVPYLNLLNALSNIEDNPVGALSAGLMLVPGAQPLALLLTVGSMLMGDDGPDIAVGHVQAGWDDAGQLSYHTVRDEEEGGREALRTMAQLNEQLEAALVQDGRLGLVPAALPEVVITREPGRDDRHPYALLWTDEQGQAQSRYYDPQGNKTHHPQTAGLQGALWADAQDTYPAGANQFAYDYMRLAQHYAVAPVAQVEAMRQQWVADIAQALPLEAQARALDAQAQPLRPYQAGFSDQGEVHYASSEPERLAQLEAQLQPLQQQAQGIRSQALTSLRDRTAQVALGAQPAPATQAQTGETGVTTQELADGTGTLYTNRDASGRVTRLLDARNTREFDGDAEHTHGGARDPGIATERNVHAGDADLHGTTSRTVASTTAQTHTTVGANDARRSDGGPGGGVTEGDAPRDTVTVSAQDLASTFTVATAQARAFVPQQPATQAQERRQALATMVRSAQAANPLAGDVGLAGLVAVGVAAAGAHLGAQAQPLVGQSMQQPAEQARTQGLAAADPAPASAQPYQEVVFTSAAGGVPASNEPAPLSLAQSHPGGDPAGSTAYRPAATGRAQAPAEPAQPAMRPVVTVEWQGGAVPAPALAAALAPASTTLATLADADPAFADGSLASARPAPFSASTPAPVSVAPPVPEPADQPGGGGHLPATPVAPLPSPIASPAPGPAPAPVPQAASPSYTFTEAPLLTQAVWQGTEDTDLVFTAGMLTELRADEGHMTLLGVGDVVGGQAALVGGQIVFRPDAHHHGDASFSFTVRNAWGLSSTGTARLQLEAVNDTPVAVGDLLALPEDIGATLTAAQLLGNDTDADAGTDGDVLTLARVFDAQHCTVVLNADGTVHFTPEPNYHGNARFSYEVVDAQGAASTAVAVVGVNAVNDAPVAQADSATIQEDQRIVLDPAALLANDTDDDIATDGDSIRVASVGNATGNATGGTARLLANGQIEFTPDAHFHGVAGFDYVAADSFGATSTARMTLNVTPVNDAPVAQGESANLDEDNAIVFTQAQLLANDSDADGATDGQILTVTAVASAQHGTVTLLVNSDGSGDVRFVPDANYHGPAQFSYTVADGAGGTAEATVSLMVLPVNDAPVAVGETADSLEDRIVHIDPASLLANDTDVDDAQAALRITAVGAAQGGTVALQALADGAQRIVFTPTPDWHGTASFSYTAVDPHGATSTATAVLQIAPENDAPVVAGETATVQEDAPLLFTAASLLANDHDVDAATDGDVLRIASVQDAQHGTAWLDAGGDVRFTPDANYHGPAAFSYTVTDGAGAQAAATVNLTVLPVNDLPQLTGELVDAEEDVVLLIAPALLLANDVDAEPGALQVTAVSGAVHGTVALVNGMDGQPQIEFVPEPDYHGPARFDYDVTDAHGGTSRATVVLNLAQINDAPRLLGETMAATEGTPLAIDAALLLANDADVDGPHGALQVTGVGNARHGSVSLAGGQVSFTPDAGWFGAAGFDYTVTDGQGGQSTATAQVDVQWVNRAPTAQADTLPTQNEDTNVLIQASALLANDSDGDSARGATDSLRITAVAAVAGQTHGTVSLTAGGDVLYVPDADYVGPVNFSYTVADAAGLQSSATAGFALANVNDAPSVVSEVYDFNEDQVAAISTASLLQNDSDVDGPGPLAVGGISDVTGGTAHLQGGQVVFTPTANYSGWGSFHYTVQDGAGGVSQARADLHFNPVNDAPVVNNEFYANGLQDTPMHFSTASLLANDTDVETPGQLAITQAWGASNGSVSLDGGTVTFVPTAGYYGAASFNYTVSDPQGGQAYGTTTLNVARVNRSPVAVDDSFATQEDLATHISHAQLLANDSDDAGAAGLRVSWVGNAVGGSVAAQGSDGLLFTPAPNYFGQARFQYQVSDAANATTTATAYVNVSPVNDAPVIMTLTNADTWGTIQAYDPDSDLSRLVYELTSAPAHGFAAVQGHQRADGVQEATWTFGANPSDPYYGPVSFTVRVRDPEGASVTGTLWVHHGGFAPVALDMDGDGVELVSAAESLIFADVDDDGQAERLGWVASDDAVLAYDADDNGQIDIARETSFVQYVPGARTDLEGLAAFDTDEDGQITAGDAEWSRFGALQDANASGTQNAGEFRSLDELGIQGISLTRQGTPTTVQGNTVFGTADVTHTDGTVTQAADVMFAVQEPEADDADEAAHFNQMAQNFNQLCATVGADSATQAPIAVIPAEPVDVIDTLVEAANAATLQIVATG